MKLSEPPDELPTDPGQQRSRADARHDPRARIGPVIGPRRYGRYVGLLALAILVLVTINIVLTKPHGVGGVATGHRVPPFAAPLASGGLEGAVNVATSSDAAGKRTACEVRGAGVLNICELYEHGPVVLALFVDGGSCAGVLADMQTLAREFPDVGFAGVAIKGERAALRKLIRVRGLHDVQVGLDPEGVLVDLYGVATCPQISFVLPGGVVQSPALLRRPPLGSLRARVSELVADARAHGWRPPR
ncbi:MAG TPA: hypothetical protein VMB51_00885 [Solirubrobacteraceae bacterium]|nr:hypothetical protein [Solirubrobacteraceae bacterium]